MRHRKSSGGFPLVSYLTKQKLTTNGGFGVGGINATGQLPSMNGNWGLIDKDTPREAYSKPGYTDSSVKMELVFSDEFNVDGRSFYPGGLLIHHLLSIWTERRLDEPELKHFCQMVSK